jgi:hypothetical protein
METTVNLCDGEQFLDGYRCGLGAAIRAIDNVHDALPRLEAQEPHLDVARVLSAITSGLRKISASATLADRAADE